MEKYTARGLRTDCFKRSCRKRRKLDFVKALKALTVGRVEFEKSLRLRDSQPQNRQAGE
jgi:hypothetical protein